MAKPVYIGTIGVAVRGVDDGTEFMCPECFEIRGQEVALRFCAMYDHGFTKGGVYGCPACGKAFIRISSQIDTIWYQWGSYVVDPEHSPATSVLLPDATREVEPPDFGVCTG